MSSSPPGPTYLSVLRLPGAAATFAIGLVGRLAYGVVTLPLLFTIQQRTGSLQIAGLALALFGVATLTAPAKSRLMDRWGQTRALAVLGALFPLPLLAVARLPGHATEPTVLALATLGGLLTPPLGPAMRYLWSRVATEPALRQRAYAMDAIAEEALYTIGPAIAGGLVALGRAEIALEVTAAAAFVGTLGLAASPLSGTYGGPRPHQAADRSLWGPLRVPALWPLVGSVTAVGTALGIVEITVAGRASAEGHPGAAGYVLACLALGSVAGATVWGRRQHDRRRTRQMMTLMAIFAVGTLLAAAAPGLVWLAAAVLLAGFGLSPLFIVAFLASDESVPESHRTEATTWINTGNNLGWSAGSAVAGSLAAGGSTYVGFLAAAAILAAMMGLLAALADLVDGSHSRAQHP